MSIEVAQPQPKDLLRFPIAYLLAVLLVVWGTAVAVDPAAVGLPFDKPVITDYEAWKTCGYYFHQESIRYRLDDAGIDLHDFVFTFGNAFIPLIVYRTALCKRIETLSLRRVYTRWLTIPLCVLVCLIFGFYFTSINSVIFYHAVPELLGFGHFSAARWFGAMYTRSILTAWAYDGMYYVGECAMILWLRRLGFKSWFLYLWLFVAIAHGLGWTAPSSRPRPTRLTASLHQIAEINDLEHKAGLDGVRVYDRVSPPQRYDAVTVRVHGRYRIYVEPLVLIDLNDSEFTAEIAHELGHVHYNHGLKDYFLGLAFDLYIWVVIGILLNRTFKNSKSSDGRPFEKTAQALPIILFVIFLTQTTFLPLQNAISRRKEDLADDYSIALTGNACSVAALQSRFSRVEFYSHPLPVLHFLMDDHPTCHDRLDHAVLSNENVDDLSFNQPNSPFLWLKDMRPD